MLVSSSLVKGLPPVTHDCLSGPAYVKEEGLRKVFDFNSKILNIADF